ncbi:uncharacterized protein LOC124113954 [Haliotis rufescens]|uniref:uncharacterized protein LOC124113954 n=1 Tax=Haliotis rufescens TaxID=6454 RepID=UPI00201F6A99|nr:uncharacterized protein LOC124113954 [Haliotis rufescens]
MAGLRVLLTYVFVCGVQSSFQFGYFHKVCNDVKRLGFQRWTNHGVVSYVRCATRCVSDNQCLSFQYNPLTGVCTGNNVSQGNSQEFDEIVDTGNCIFYPVEETGTIGVACNNNADCHEAMSVCYEGICKCTPGYSYSPTNVTCVSETGTIGDECKNNADYSVTMSVCYEGTCKCTPGYSNSPTSATCVRVCSEYGFDMTKYPGLGITGHNTITSYGLTPEECVTACVTQTTYVCVSTDMKLSDGRCSLQEVGYLDVNGIYRETEVDGWVFSTRNCAA